MMNFIFTELILADGDFRKDIARAYTYFNLKEQIHAKISNIYFCRFIFVDLCEIQNKSKVKVTFSQRKEIPMEMLV